MLKVAKKRVGILHCLVGFLKPWIAFTGLYATFSVCPFCGQSGCPTGVGSAGVVGALMALGVQKWGSLFGQKNRCKHPHTNCRQGTMTKGVEGMTYFATEIEAGYHPRGFRIDKGADPLNRYTRWTVDDEGNWSDVKPVCFHSMPDEGWLKSENTK